MDYFIIDCKRNREDKIISYIKNNKNINEKSIHNDTAFIMYCKYSYVKIHIIDLFIQKGANIHIINIHGFNSILTYLCNEHSCDIKIIQYLIKNGADIKVKTENDMDALLIYCSKYYDVNIIKYLINQGININNTQH